MTGQGPYTFCMRLFIAIPLAVPVVDELSAISLRLQSSGDGLRWSLPESWHITLVFLGSTGPEQFECIVARLREVRMPPVPVKLEGTGFFDRAGIFFAGVSLTPELLALQQRVGAATRLCGFIPETRPYHPHITLARSKGKSGAQGLRKLKTQIRRQPSFTSFVAEDFLLYESFTKPTGSLYEVRERFPLDGEEGKPPN
jgi:RNA 2',3'-cyclic 3'-phosphodiesterase